MMVPNLSRRVQSRPDGLLQPSIQLDLIEVVYMEVFGRRMNEKYEKDFINIESGIPLVISLKLRQ